MGRGVRGLGSRESNYIVRFQGFGLGIKDMACWDECISYSFRALGFEVWSMVL